MLENMALGWRIAKESDVRTLAQLNAQLIEDEGHPQARSIAELEARMRGWLDGEYEAVLFEDGGRPLAYVLYRDNEGRGIYVRQFFVARERRRQGIGRRAFALLLREVLPPDTRVVLDVLMANERALAFWQALGFCDYARMLERRG